MRAAFLIVIVTVLALAGTAHAAPGDLDSTYAEDGWRTIDLPGDDERGRAVAIAPDGAILVAGGAGGDFALVRSSADGSAFVPQTTDFGGDNDDANGLALQGFGGKLVVTGFTNSPGPERHFATARYNADLALDGTFSGDGRQTTDLGADAAAIAVAVHPAPDYRIVQVGPGQIGSGDDFALARHGVSGAPDPAFGGGDGWLTSDIGGVDQANAVAIDAGGRIVVAGATGFDFAVARYRAIDGAPDTSFSPLGHRATDFGGAPDAAYGVAIQSDGKIVVVGHAGSDLALARYHENGTPDTSFSGDGKQTTDFGEAAIARAVAVQPDGRIVVGGAALSSSASDFDFALARYNPDGSLDTSFSGDGKKTTDLGSNDLAAAVALQPDGKIVLAGASTPNEAGGFAIARYEGTPPDGDGDGVPDAGDACPAVAAGTANGCPAPVAPAIPIPVPAPAAGGATAGPDVFVGAAGVRNVFRAGAGDDRLTGGPLADLLCGEAGDDRIDGGGGADRLYGDSCPGARLAAAAGEGDDVIRGGSGNDRLVGSGGNDRLTGGAGADRMDGGAGRDKLSGGAGDDRLTGGAGNDTLAGGAGRNRYAGGAGNDRLSAANGKRDRVDCGAGRDRARVDRADRVTGCEKVTRRR